MMRIEERVIKFLEEQPYRTFKPKELSRQFKIKQADYSNFRRMLKRLIADGKVFKYKHGRIGMGRKSKQITGRLHVKSQGYGFLVRENIDKDIFISHLNMGTAFNGDLVRVELFADSQRGRNVEGRVVEVLERATAQFVGTFQESKYWGFVVPDDPKVVRDIYITPEHKNNAKSGQKVVVRLSGWENEHLNPEGEIVEVLGYPDEPGVDVLSIARRHQVATQFSARAEHDAATFDERIPAGELERRLDLRNVVCFTIDPEDARDFDDAVSLEKLDIGLFRLGVHIADVSYYVTPQSNIDQEAYERGTSIYLVDRVIPMLPERLSNQLCSLVPDEDRLTMTVLMDLDENGKLQHVSFHEAIIHSRRRFTYEEVQQLIEKPVPDDPFSDIIQSMYALLKKRLARRVRRGGLDFGSHEVKVKLDNTGRPVDIIRMQQLDSHRLVEEFMILANTSVATWVSKLRQGNAPANLPFPYRIHERPAKDKLRVFVDYLQALGISTVHPKQLTTPKSFQRVLQQIDDPDRKTLVQDMMVRSMMKAKYDTENIGHFGLALKYYCHFTSPIRRYPDLLCHRLLKAYLSKPEPSQISRQWLQQACEHATQREIAAQEAERASVKIKQLEFMEQFIGEKFAGIISGVLQFGLFVEITAYLVEGLVHITNLPDDYYIYDEKRFMLYGQYQNREYRLGDHVMVSVASVNREAQQLDFEIVE